MTLSIHLAVLGPIENNFYFLVDEDGGDCVLIDPSFVPQTQLRLASEHGWQLRQIWLTHGHYDHIAGAKTVSEAFFASSSNRHAPTELRVGYRSARKDENGQEG